MYEYQLNHISVSKALKKLEKACKEDNGHTHITETGSIRRENLSWTNMRVVETNTISACRQLREQGNCTVDITEK